MNSELIEVDVLRRSLSLHHQADERSALVSLVGEARLDHSSSARVKHRARELVEALRRRARGGGGIERFLQEYRISEPEGLALLSLAEAYLRIPDQNTANSLIRDKLRAGDWHAHIGQADSPLVNLATIALSLARRLVGRDHHHDRAIDRLTRSGAEPSLRVAVGLAMRAMGGQFVLGHSIENALKEARPLERLGFLYSYDMLGEGAHTIQDANRYLHSYDHAIEAIGGLGSGHREIQRRPSISVKLSALYPRYELAQAARAVPALEERLMQLCIRAKEASIGLTVDAEEADRLEVSLDILSRVAMSRELDGWDGLGLAVQAYQKRARPLIDWIDALARSTGRRMSVRLVKGAYWDSEIKRAQERGLSSYPVFTRKAATDVSYLACAQAMFRSANIYPAYATHNALTVSTLLEWAGDRRDFEFQRLHGMGNGLYDSLVSNDGVHCRIYAPVGTHRDLLAYLVRRLLENGANASFINQIANPHVDVETLLRDPIEIIELSGMSPNPLIPPPSDLYGLERKNSLGLDLNDRSVLSCISASLNDYSAEAAYPIVDGRIVKGRERKLYSPANRNHCIGTAVDTDVHLVAKAAQSAAHAMKEWSSRSAHDRAIVIERLADRLTSDMVRFVVLAVKEAGKTIPDAVAEVREAIDFCRYYSKQARTEFQPLNLPGPTGETNVLHFAGRGVFACISPWNFPLAIFLGQVTAALVSGNAVLAKPAPQTCLIAYQAVRLLHECGVPPSVLHLLPGESDIGQAVVEDPNISGVAFTGSTRTARSIARTLASREGPIVPLIAETGGINAMIVDSSALPEQVVEDVITSAFRSAGQRCSALRLLYLQDDTAPAILTMLAGAMEQLVVGDPAEISTDVGPVIDRAAQERLRIHSASRIGRTLKKLELDPACDQGMFVAPELILLDRPEQLRDEVFGPILHVVTWRAGALEQVMEQINATGYGLTLGVHTRIQETVMYIQARARVGNLYVNRAMVGAVVGVQPFGGEGLSGTGPKAGGPRYLARFATERSISIDTTSNGGNAILMSLTDDSA